MVCQTLEMPPTYAFQGGVLGASSLHAPFGGERHRLLTITYVLPGRCLWASCTSLLALSQRSMVYRKEDLGTEDLHEIHVFVWMGRVCAQKVQNCNVGPSSFSAENLR